MGDKFETMGETQEGKIDENLKLTLDSERDKKQAVSTKGMWDSLTTECQEWILSKLETRQLLLPCRFVNSEWKARVDSVLQKQVVSNWKKWDELSDPCDYAPWTDLPALKLSESKLKTRFGRGKWNPQAWNHSSISTTHNPKLGSPFPTNSFQTTFTHKVYAYCKFDLRKDKLEMISDLFDNCGKYLTVCRFSSFEIKLVDLWDIFSSLINVKVLSICNIFLISYDFMNKRGELAKGVAPPSNFPPMENLTHLKIGLCNDSLSWLLINSYHSQLVSLETDFSPSSIFSLPFTNLTHLKCAGNPKLCSGFPQLQPSSISKLQYFSVICDKRIMLYYWEEVIFYVMHLPQTLIQVHLDVQFYEDYSSPYLQCLTENYPTFQNVKKLGISFPRSEKQAEWFGLLLLPKFPDVKVLGFRWHEGLAKVIDSNFKNLLLQKLKEMAVAGNFWSVCPKLEKIVLKSDPSERVENVMLSRDD